MRTDLEALSGYFMWTMVAISKPYITQCGVPFTHNKNQKVTFFFFSAGSQQHAEVETENGLFPVITSLKILNKGGRWLSHNI